MQISNATVFKKMQKEIEAAKSAQTPPAIASHMANIKLISELWLEEYGKPDLHSSHVLKQPVKTTVMEPTVDVTMTKKEDKDMSIFDF